MINLDQIGEDLFNKIRGRFPSVTIGDEEGNVTNEPSAARFFDFDYKTGERSLGKVSVSISEDDGLTVIFSKDFIQHENELTQDEWYGFLRELRVFSKKRLMDFSIRDINKSNLNKRDYQFLANRSGDGTMNESKLYGTSRVSYQKFDNARMVIKHTESINPEQPTARTQKIGAIYIESAEGERFKYPYKHLSGARAMARHVSEGGKPYDDFGAHITGLSEELNKLRKFKTYMGRSAVMAESLAGYMDIVKERISVVRKTVENLQKPNYYKEAFDSFETPIYEEVPEDVAENWIDELTIKQFNEELADVFPYIYNLVKEGTKAKELGPDDLVAETELDEIKGVFKNLKKHAANLGDKFVQGALHGATFGQLGHDTWDPLTGDTYDKVKPFSNRLKKKNKKTKEEFEIEQAFEDAMGQFADDVCEECGNPSWRTLGMTEEEIEEGERHGNSKIYDKCWKGWRKVPDKKRGEPGSCKKIGEADLEEAYIKTSKDAIDTLGNLRKIGKKIETGQDTYDGNLAGMYTNDVYDVISWVENNLDTNDPKYTQVLAPVIELRKKAKGMETQPGSGKDARFGNEIVNTLYPLMQWIEMAAMDAKEGNAFAHTVRKAKMDGKKKGDKVTGPDGKEITLEKQKTPLGEFILSYFDRHSGQFPKGETAVLTMVEKDYGEEFIEPAKAFIEQINNLVAERFGYKEADVQEGPFKGLGKMMMKRKLKKDMSTHDDEMDDILDIGGTDDEFANAYDQKARKKKALSRLSRESNNTEIQNISRLAGL